MATNRPAETRHRWTKAEIARLIEQSAPHSTIGEAADALYVGFALPRQAVAGKLYQLHLKGLLPWLTVSREMKDEVGPAFTAALCELVRTMRIEGISDALVNIGPPATVQIQRRTVTLEIPLEEE